MESPSLYSAALFNGENAGFLDQQYRRWLDAPEQFAEDWQQLFAQTESANPLGSNAAAQQPVCASALKKQIAVTLLTQAIRHKGHLHARLDPLGLQPVPQIRQLNPQSWGLEAADTQQAFDVTFGGQQANMQLHQILSLYQTAWCGTTGYEVMHLEDAGEIDWLMSRIEQSAPAAATAPEKLARLELLTRAEALERYLHTRYVGQKRFSLEGGESTIPAIHALIAQLSRLGVEELVIGMAHRGRLNVLVNVMGKSPALLYAEFEGKQPQLPGSGDVKYHLGYARNIETAHGAMHLSLACNPSHLEIVNPVVQGQVRARQDRRSDAARQQVAALLIHGDSALGGLGVNQTTFTLAATRGYTTGGTVHLVINNQIGFTTSQPQDMRSFRYCTDIAKGAGMPVLHVNGDDVDAVCRAMNLAAEWRQTFHKDIAIDLVCFRRHGHNESDEPRLTQPQMYQAVDSHPGVRSRYADKLVQQGVLSQQQAVAMVAAAREWLDNPAAENRQQDTSHRWDTFDQHGWRPITGTQVSRERIAGWGDTLSCVPPGFTVHPTVKRQLAQRRAMSLGEQPVDWGMAEALAWASLVEEGHRVRLSGEDAGRGTFSHRHAVLHDQQQAGSYIPLQHISPQQAAFEVIDSVLNEEALLAWEYGYSTSAPDALTIWEAQFGDFANGAQVAIDQFVCSGETKWQRYSGLTLILPHGYDGQGPEHSSARPERWLQLCAENNMQVVMPSESSQMFHLLRGQVTRPMRKPLIILMSKRLLRAKAAMSELARFTDDSFRPVIGDPLNLPAKQIRQVILCSGQVYYDALDARQQRGLDDSVAIIRLEQLYPFPTEALAALLAPLRHCQHWVWLQEEPENQGAWRQIHHHLVALSPGGRWRYAGRPAAAAPATGYGAVHRQQITDFLNDAFAPGMQDVEKKITAGAEQ
ncbi:2-oxoglutarate dehydrogenase E1 component [Gibbsiella quercinecans]|uniref:2-oxoglutarate dehydrogenase E1 component n=1 Tax=Gibbsiella quercinecans TaxID=929813 RepID=UPI000F11C853|nr:2-oxoglutarate dehydrogenase E1 component [Gibbsiella quercinecans]RLM09843.1 2-oxoglutarate dehydrogenase E1 component [Gibbsiella quercinecans]